MAVPRAPSAVYGFFGLEFSLDYHRYLYVNHRLSNMDQE